MIVNFADHSANERTFLAWVRTAIAIVGFGMATARLGGAGVQVWSEVLMLATGGLVVGLAYLRMRRLRRRILSDKLLDDDTAPADAMLLLLVAALFALLASFALHVSKAPRAVFRAVFTCPKGRPEQARIMPRRLPDTGA